MNTLETITGHDLGKKLQLREGPLLVPLVGAAQLLRHPCRVPHFGRGWAKSFVVKSAVLPANAVQKSNKLEPSPLEFPSFISRCIRLMELFGDEWRREERRWELVCPQLHFS